jgi:hypothetical protein
VREEVPRHSGGGTMQNAVAFANNDVVTVAWSYGKKPSGCMGFALYRIDNKGTETVLPSHAVFKGGEIKAGQTTREFPIQKFYWKDPYARLIAERTGNRSFRYKIVPLEGPTKALTQMKNLPVLTTSEVTLTPEVSKGVSAFFNRGLISTQRISRAFNGKPAKGPLLKRVGIENDALRKSLTGDMVGALTGFVDRAKKSGKIYAALYELGDEELIKKLEQLGNRLNLVLSNSVQTDPQTKKKVDGNEGARRRVEKTTKYIWNRIMPSNHIGHNKFLVFVDAKGTPRAVLFGSTNWTPTGLCTQTNNTMVVEDTDLAKRYLDYWHKLADDTEAANNVPKNLQGASLRSWDSTTKDTKLPGGYTAESWYSPNTPKQRGKNTEGEKHPPDMAAVIAKMNGAKQAILFLAFYPGTPSLANWAADALKKNKDLFVRGCVTNKSASGAFYYELRGLTPPKKVKGVKTMGILFQRDGKRKS